jgi:thermosome
MPEDQLRGQQILYLPEGATRLLGRDAQRTNIAVGIAVANAVKSALGPKEVWDGTTSVVVIAGELLRGAGELLEQGVHPTSIIKGYKIAAEKAAKVARERSMNVNLDDESILQKIAMVSMGSKNVGGEETKALLSKLVIKSVKQVMDKDARGNTVIDHDLIKVEKKAGGTIGDTSFISGVLIDKEISHPGMPKSIKNAKIALLDLALEIEKTEIDAKIEITSPEQMQAFLQQEEKMLKTMVEKVSKSKVTVLFTQKGIDDVAQHFLSKAGIIAVRRIKKSDMEKISKATGAKVVTSLDDLTEKDLGFAGMVEERKIGGEQMVFVEDCKNPKSVTIFIRGGTQQAIDETERSVTDVVGAISSVLEDGKYVLGGGAIEVDIANALRSYSNEIGGREQLAIQKFADALEIVPKTLSESAGMDAIDTLVQLRNKHRSKEGSVYGVDIYKNAVGDMDKLGVYEPLRIKEQALYSASEAAEIILRIDDMISSKSKGPGPGGMGGHGAGEME